ncbi:MAG: ATP-binding protein [Armatimonadetes bacterium]|nr:ATP-binding protein [Armatimonadota bacterium]
MHYAPLVDLVHNAKLPFIGREEERAQLHQFWEDVESQQRLVVGLLVGEAGIGKSTLLEQFLSELGDDCTLLHIRFIPGASTSPIRAIARAVASYLSGGMLHPASDLSETLIEIAATKRLLIVLEDIHLLSDEGLGQLLALLATLRTTPLALLCLSRPLPIETMQQLSAVVDCTIVLHGLQPAEVSTLWHRLFSEYPSSAIVNSITAATVGNPLVIRSGLLRALHNNAISPIIRPQQVAVVVHLQDFQQLLLDSTRSISGVITQHLAKGALRQLQALATLGEVFSIEAANIVTSNISSLLAEFQQRGILAVAPAAHTSLIPTHSSLPQLLAFSHTILHRELLNDATPDSAALLAVFGAKTPLYSTTPFSLIAAATDLNTLTSELLLQALEGIHFYLGSIFASDDWRLSELLLLAAEKVLAAIRDDPNNISLTEARISLVMLQMERSSRLHDLQLYSDQMSDLIRLTSSTLPASLQHYRLVGKSAKARHIAFHQPEELLAAINELYDEARQWKSQHLRGQQYPVGFKTTLVALLALARRCRHHEVIYWAAEHLETVLESLDLHDPVEIEEYTETLPFILFVRRSEAEFQKRIATLQRLESFGPLPTTLLATKGHLLVIAGQAVQGLSILEQVLGRLQKNQQFVHLISAVGSWCLAQGMIGKPLQKTIENAALLLRDVPPSFPNMAVDTAIATTAILSYNIEDQHKVEELLPRVEKQANTKVLRYFATVRHDSYAITELAPPSEEENDLYIIVAAVFQSTALTPLLETAIIEKLKMEIVEATDLLHFRDLLHCVEWMVQHSYPCQKRILPVATEEARKWLRWLYQHELFTYANALVVRFGGLIPEMKKEMELLALRRI